MLDGATRRALNGANALHYYTLVPGFRVLGPWTLDFETLDYDGNPGSRDPDHSLTCPGSLVPGFRALGYWTLDFETLDFPSSQPRIPFEADKLDSNR